MELPVKMSITLPVFRRIPLAQRVVATMLSLCFALFLTAPARAEEGAAFTLDATTRVKAILRSGPGTSYQAVQVFSAGVQVILLGKEGDWYQVRRGDYSGYMRQDLLVIGGIAGGADPGASPSYISDPLNDGTYLPPPPPPPDSGYVPVTTDPNTTDPASDGLPTNDVSLPATQPNAQGLGWRVLKQGSRGTDVLQLQQLLAQHGFDPRGLDGAFGPGTRSAVTNFQRQNGIATDGVVGAQTVSLLTGGNAAQADADGTALTPPPFVETQTEAQNETQAETQTETPSEPTPASGTDVSYLRPAGSYKMLSKGSSGSAVTALQTALQILGYYAGSITGSYDTATYDAVKTFQKNNGTGVDGVAGSATQTILYERTPRPAWEAAPSPAPLPEGAGQMQGPSAGQVELAHWFNDVKLRYRAGQTYSVYDPATGLGWNLSFYAMGNHADSEPLTQLDTDIMFKAFGYINTWTPKAVYAHMPDGRWILASMHNTPHLTGAVKDNGFDGHLCVHFYRDMEEASRNDPNYGVQNQNVIRTAWARLQGQ